MKAKLSKKDDQFRDLALNGNMGRLMMQVCLPLTLYQCLNTIFRMFDTMLAARISSSAVTTVAYLSQISTMLSAVGAGLAVGAGIKISEAFGAGKYELVKKRVSTVFAICALVCGAILLVFVPFAPSLLKLFGTPDRLIAQGSTYFIIELFGMVVTFFNNVYISIERSRGNSNRIFRLNIAVAITKLTLSMCFVYGWEPMGFGEPTISLLSVASLCANSIILIAAIILMRQKDNLFGFSIHAISFTREVIGPVITVSFPVIVEKFAFTYGRVLVNSMCTDESLEYHPDTVGATSISNQISGMTTTPQNGFQEGGSAIISQNLGAGKPERVISAFKWMFGLSVGISFCTMILSLLVLKPLSLFLAAGNAEFSAMISTIYHYEAIAVIPLAINSVVHGLLYGLGKTKYTLIMNFCRIIVFRVPVLFCLHHFTVMGQVDGPNTIGLCLALSNLMSGALALAFAIKELRALCKKNRLSFWKKTDASADKGTEVG